MRTVAIVQARIGSTRLPGKVLKPVCGKPLIELLLGRLAKSKRIDEVVLATGQGNENDALETLVISLGFKCYRGSETDVLNRFFTAARKANADTIVRITGDCPLVDPALVDAVLDKYIDSKADYASNVEPPTYPDGLDIEVFSFEALKQAEKNSTSAFEREHVTPYLRTSSNFQRVNIEAENDNSDMRWTVDEPGDLEVVENIFRHFEPNTDFTWSQILELQRKIPKLFSANQQYARNEGTLMNSGQKLWKRAKQVIPGGTMLLSKRPEMFLPDQWPSYFSKTKGCAVWDLDDNKFFDLSLMGVGTNTLGYGHPEVDEAVKQTVTNGNMSTLNCPEEVYLAERLIEMHPWAGGVRFTRAGGEANSVAIRIARAFSGRNTVAVCGYHGWHDWYLSANLGDSECLAGHLLPGLDPTGVPENLRGSVLPFEYNDFETLEKLVKDHEIGVIKMEVVRNLPPTDNFLSKVRKLATDNEIVLIFDECTSGFRQTFGGLHTEFDIEPDMAVFGKTLGNGYAINAVIGRKEVMDVAQVSFISSTFWTERIGPTAALKTLEVMERIKSWETISQIGNDIRTRWQVLADKHGLGVNHWGLAALAGYTFQSEHALEYKTLITQEMLASGFLAGTSVYACIEHTKEIIDQYFEALDPIYKTIAECEGGRNIGPLLKGPVCHSGFRRLN